MIDQSNPDIDNKLENESETISSTPKPKRTRPSGRRGGKPDPKAHQKESSGQCHGSLCGKSDIPDEM